MTAFSLCLKPSKSSKKVDLLFEGEEEEEGGGDLFTFGAPSKKKAAPKPSKAAKVEDDDLFADPLMGGVVAGTSSKPKPKAKVETDKLFGGSVSPPREDLFKPPKLAKTETKSQLPKEKERDRLFSNDSLTGSIEPPPPPKKSSESPKVSRPAPKPKTGGLFDDGGSDDDLFGTPEPKKPEKTEELPKKKKLPAGAVSLFGGVDPFAAAKKKTPERALEKPPDHPEPRPPKEHKKDDLFGKF